MDMKRPLISDTTRLLPIHPNLGICFNFFSSQCHNIKDVFIIEISKDS